MSADVHVKESQLLRRCAVILQEFISAIKGEDLNVMRKLEEQESKLDGLLRYMEQLESDIMSDVRHLVSKYEDAKRRYSLDEGNCERLGDSDEKALQKLESLRMYIEIQQERISSIRIKIQTLREHIKAYELKTSQIAEHGGDILMMHADIIDTYKTAH